MNKGEFPILLVVIHGYISALFISPIHARKQKENTTHPLRTNGGLDLLLENLKIHYFYKRLVAYLIFIILLAANKDVRDILFRCHLD